MKQEGLSLSISVDQKVGLPNYGSASVFLSVSGVTASTTEDEIDELLDNSKIVYAKIAERIRAKVREIKTQGQV